MPSSAVWHETGGPGRVLRLRWENGPNSECLDPDRAGPSYIVLGPQVNGSLVMQSSKMITAVTRARNICTSSQKEQFLSEEPLTLYFDNKLPRRSL